MIVFPNVTRSLRWRSPHAVPICWERLDYSIQRTVRRGVADSRGATSIVGCLEFDRFQIRRALWPIGVWCITGVVEPLGDQTQVVARFHLHWLARLILLSWIAGLVGCAGGGLVIWAGGGSDVARSGLGLGLGVVAAVLLMLLPWVVSVFRQIRCLHTSDFARLESWLREVLDVTA